MVHGATILFAASCTLISTLADEEVSLLQTKVHLHEPMTAAEIMESFRAETTVPDEKDVLATMAAAPLDPATQLSGCRALGMVITEKGDEVLRPSVVEALVQAAKNHVADPELVTTCFAALGGFGATFNRPRTLAINNGTHIAEAVATVLRHYPHDHDMQLDALLWVAGFSTYVACEVQPPFVDTGCIDMVWDALDYFTGRENSDVQMSAWQGFSDHSGCKYSANAIANHGGKLEGVKRTVQALRDALGNEFHPNELHGGHAISLQYEIMTVANGLLNNADGTFDAFIEAGYLPAVLNSMRDQPNDRSTNERACEALSILSATATTHSALEAGGAVEHMATAMEKFKGPDHTIFVNAEVGNFYPVLPACDIALFNLASNCTAVQDHLLQLGVLETYETMRQDLPQQFPWMDKLPALLRARKGQVKHEG